jgi:CYTH domain-containing protein
MGKEIERKFIVKELPEDLHEYPSYAIHQYYISKNPEIRLRWTFNYKDGNKYYLTFKGDGSLERTEYEVEVDQQQFIILHERTLYEIHKTRYEYPYKWNLYGNSNLELKHTLYVDIYYDNDLQIVEIEFESLRLADNFIYPDWFGEELTYDNSYKNKNLARRIDKPLIGETNRLIGEIQKENSENNTKIENESKLSIKKVKSFFF